MNRFGCMAILLLFSVFCGCSDDDEVFYMPNSQEMIKHELLSVINKMKVTDKTHETLNWNMKIPLHKWRGVSKNGIYLSVNISDAGLGGEIPAELFDIPYLNKLDLSGNNLTGNLPLSVTKAVNLRQADFSGNRLSGRVSDTVKSHPYYLNFTFFPQQRDYRLTNVSSAGESESDKRILLDMLSQWGMSVSEDVWRTWTEETPLRDFYGVTVNGNGRVTALELADITDIPAGIAGLDKLSELMISHSDISGFAAVAELPELYDLILSECGIDSLPAQLAANSSIKEIYFKNCDFKEGLPAVLFEMKQLKVFSAVDCDLEGQVPAAFSNLSELLFLDLSENGFRNLPAEISALKNLICLDLSGNALVTVKGEALKGLSALQVLDLGDNACRGKLPKEIGDLKELVHLSLRNNNFLGEIPLTFGNLTHLESLDMTNCEDFLSQPFPYFVTGMKSLRFLYLANCNLRGAISPDIAKLHDLHSLYLDNNKLTGSLPESMKDMGSLFNLDVTYNNMSGEISPRLFDHCYFMLWRLDPQNEGYGFSNFPHRVESYAGKNMEDPVEEYKQGILKSIRWEK